MGILFTPIGLIVLVCILVASTILYKVFLHSEKVKKFAEEITDENLPTTKNKIELQEEIEDIDEYDSFLEDALNGTTQIPSTTRSIELPSWLQKIGSTVLLRYIACENKVRQWWRWTLHKPTAQ